MSVGCLISWLMPCSPEGPSQQSAPLLTGSLLSLYVCVVCVTRLKMGVCEGIPQSVVQDHLGRADYHGDTVNQVRPGAGSGAGGGRGRSDYYGDIVNPASPGAGAGRGRGRG